MNMSRVDLCVKQKLVDEWWYGETKSHVKMSTRPKYYIIIISKMRSILYISRISWKMISYTLKSMKLLTKIEFLHFEQG